VNDPYLAVTARYIALPENQANNWELHSKVLGYTGIEGNHSGANTAAVILQVVDRYGICHKASVVLMLLGQFLWYSSLDGLWQTMQLQMIEQCKSCSASWTVQVVGDELLLSAMAGTSHL